VKVAVVGGSLAGLAAAVRLVDEGHAVTLFERRATLGGRAARQGTIEIFGCARATRSLLRRLGTHDRLPFLGGARRTALPPPLHLLAGLPGIGENAELGVLGRLALVRISNAIAHPSAKQPAARDYETVDAWLERMGQPERLCRALWRPLAKRVLDEDSDTASALPFAGFVRDLIFGNPDDARAAKLDVTALIIEPARRHLEAHATVRMSTAVTALDRSAFDATILAVKPRDVLALVPSSVAREPYFTALARISYTDHAQAPRLTPGSDELRPHVRSPIEGVFLAADYVRTGMPADLESAVRAADEACVLISEHEVPAAPVESPPPSGNFVALGRLRR
jgi:hypothetical protein